MKLATGNGMKLLPLLAVAGLLLQPVTAWGGTQKEYAYLHVRGRILSPSGERPMAGATIHLANGSSVFEAVTDERGVFVFEKLPIAAYDLRISGSDGEVLKRIEQVDVELPDLRRFAVRFGKGEERSASIQATEDGVTIVAPPPPVRWNRFWKQSAIFFGAAVLLAI